MKYEFEFMKFSQIIEQSPVSIIITDNKGIIQFVNPRFEETSGYNKDELIGNNINILKSGRHSSEHYKNINDTIYKGEIWKGELLNKKKNGELYWEKVIISPIKNDTGEITNFVASKEEITEYKKIQEDFKLKKIAIESSINAIAITNPVGNITYVNPSFMKMWNYSNLDDIINKPIVKFWLMKGKYMDVMDSLVTEGGWVGELVAERSDKSTFHVQLSATLLRDENNNITNMLASFVDVTEQKIAEEALRKTKDKIQEQNIKLKKLDELKSTFLNVTSHELRTPMASIKGYIQMILKQTLGQTTDEQKKALNVVLRNIERLDHLIQDILDISRLESGTMKFITEKTDIYNMINEIRETMQSSASEKNIVIKTDINENIPNIVVDHDRIKQVIINFINNAIKFSEKDKEIIIRVNQEEENIIFEIQDFGRGIPKEKQKKVFETFYQVDSGMDRKFGGAGLGLAISRGIVIAHGGNIWVESEEGKGSTFKFTLPKESVEDIEGRFREVDVFRLEEIYDEYERYKNRSKI